MKMPISRLGSQIMLGAGLVLAFALPALSASQAPSSQTPAAASKQTNEHAPATEQSVGERKFNQNCSRCHKAPESFPPHISGTILRHMRVRASLSEQDERDILHFLNP